MSASYSFLEPKLVLKHITFINQLRHYQLLKNFTESCRYHYCRYDEHSFKGLFFLETGVRRPVENEEGTIPIVNTIWKRRARWGKKKRGSIYEVFDANVIWTSLERFPDFTSYTINIRNRYSKHWFDVYRKYLFECDFGGIFYEWVWFWKLSGKMLFP